ncbi:MAG: ATP-binding protein [Gemmataceae bacterium]|nr:ATP-binding protein [Gemmataceae bacterium]
MPRHRQIVKLLRQRLLEYPAVALVGPRQSGKTTLARTLSKLYFDLEQPADRLRLDLAWPSLVERNQLAILDEAQVWPEIFPRLRGAIDGRRRQNGRFLLLGSIAPPLMREVSQSLAGRLALVELAPFHLRELPLGKAEQLWRMGGYPDGGVLRKRAFPHWQINYLQILAQRDLPAWGLPAKPGLTTRLFHMLAANQGAILNASQLGQSLGLSFHTVQSYLDYLEGAFLIRRLSPFAANLRKRLVKAPKVYWRDSGLLHALLGVTEKTDLFAQSWIGASWEGHVIEQILAVRRAQGDELQASFFRSHDGWEADLILEGNGEREVIEVKLTTAPSPEDFSRLDQAADLVGGTRRVLISWTRQAVMEGRRWSVDLAGYLKRVSSGR